MRDRAGISLVEWVNAIYFITTVCSSRELPEVIQAPVVINPSKLPLSPAGQRAVAATMNLLAASVDDFSARCKDIHCTSSLLEWPSVMPLIESPVVFDTPDGEFMLLSVDHLAMAALRAPLRFLRLAGDPNPYQDFGYVVETTFTTAAETHMAIDISRSIRIRTDSALMGSSGTRTRSSLSSQRRENRPIEHSIRHARKMSSPPK